MDTVTYSLTSFILNSLKEEKKNFDKLIVFGCFIGFLSMALTAPLPILLPEKFEIMCFGILMTGSAGALCNNNLIPALTKILEK
jgi:hypothetical protein